MNMSMTLEQFKNSKWYRQAQRPGARGRVRRQFFRWIHTVTHLGLAARARELWSYLTSPRASRADKILVIAALLYLISPIDLIPDVIPLAGWLDDLGIATMVVRHLMGKLDRHAAEQAEDQAPATGPLTDAPSGA